MPLSRRIVTPGATVSPTKEAVQSALVEVLDRVTSLTLVVDVHNGNLSTSWPMVMFSFVTTQKNVKSSDCNWITYGQQLLAWTQLNEKAISTTEALGFVPLPLAYKRSTITTTITVNSLISDLTVPDVPSRLLMDTYGLLSCNGKQTFTSKVVIGKGDNFKIGPIWTRAYPFDTNFQMTFYTEANATNALAELTASTREQ